MALVLTEEQQLLKDSAKGFLAEKAPVAALRKLRDDGVAGGYSSNLWAEMATMGWAGIIVPEEHGGLGFDHVGVGLIMEEMGRNLTASPFLSSAIMGVTAIAGVGSDEQKSALLPKIASGELITALAVDEGRRHDPLKTAMEAKPSGNGYVLNGKKAFVVDGGNADQLIVAARTSGKAGEADGITLFLVPSDAEGVKTDTIAMVDSRNAADVVFDNVAVTGEQVLGELDKGHDALEHCLNVGRICLAAEALGTAQQSFEMTMDYIRERKQFGVAIGSFQSLQHRAAHLYTEIELAKSLVLKALQALDLGGKDVPLLASAVKAKLAEVVKLSTAEGVQMFGGMGMTDEFDIGFYMKRARVQQQAYGDYNYHLNKMAELSGY
jgi:alkylation response protein AidB-like acyl-CoA dehydrogenase